MAADSMNRRTLLRRASAVAAAGGLGLHHSLSIAAAANAAGPLAPSPGHFPVRAKHLIVFFMTGGFSHLDTFDYKPKLQKDHDKKVGALKVLASPYKFRPRGASGKMVSELFEHVGAVVDDLCFLHTVHGDSAGHSAATLGMHTGSVTIPLPSLGSWISYGLGTLNANLPSFVVLAAREPYNGYQVWDSNFLPAYHKGVRVIPGPTPLPDVKSPVASVTRQELERRMLRDLNEAHLRARDGDEALAARMATFDTAAGLMREAPDAFDIASERRHTLDLYGADAGNPGSFAAQCLVARRLVERGVRVVELFDVGSNTNWDSHTNIDDHRALVAQRRSADRGPGNRPEAARFTRRDVDRRLLGVRPHALSGFDPARPRSPQPLLHLFPRWRRRKGRDQLRPLRRLRRRPRRESRARP